jgi:hypothetical protein
LAVMMMTAWLAATTSSSSAATVQHEFTVEPTFATAVSPKKLKPATPPRKQSLRPSYSWL